MFWLISGNFGALQVHNAGNKLGRLCDMCSNYEKQLQGIQIQEAETRDQVSFIRATELHFFFRLLYEVYLSGYGII